MRGLMRKLCEVLHCCMSTIVDFGLFSIESKMFPFWSYILAVLSLVLSDDSRPKSVSCPLVDLEVTTIGDVKACVQSLTKRNPTDYCDSNKADCELDFADCGQTNATHSLLCVWRNCFDSCLLMSDDQDICVESCLGLKDECDSSKSVQEVIDCHVKFLKGRATVDKTKILCPVLPTNQFDLEFEVCVGDVNFLLSEKTCQRLGSACKYADIDNCKNSIRNHWFDTRLLCAATHCNQICSGQSSESSKIFCIEDCIGKDGCKERKGEDLLLCSIEASEKFLSEHKRFKPYPSRPIIHDKRKLVDCSLLLSIFNISDPRDEKQNPFTDCILMMMTMNMDKYCETYEEDCRLFADDCKQAKPMKLLYALERLESTKKLPVDTHMACLGHKCSEACSDQWKENPSMVFKCRTNCIGDIEKCSSQTSSLERLNCHIDHADKFINEGQNEEWTGDNEEARPGGGFKSPQETKKRTSNPGNGQKPKVEVTIAILSVLLYKALGLIFNDTLL